MTSLPLAGRRVLVTRSREQSSTLAAGLRSLGADVLEIPTIQIAPLASCEELDAALSRLAVAGPPVYDTLLVTSANTARVLAERLPVVSSEQPFTVAVGPATAAALRAAGWRVDLIPEPAVAESVIRELAPGARGKRMLLLRAEQAREVLPEALRAAGAVVDVVAAYRTVTAEASRALLEQAFADVPSDRSQVGIQQEGTLQTPMKVDAITFSSSSTARNLWSLLGADRARTLLAQVAACSIGPITSATLRELGVEPNAEAMPHDVDGLIDAVVRVLMKN